MKLYTEETVKFIAKAIYEHDFDSNKTPEELVDELKPIELPSDEKIQDAANEYAENKKRMKNLSNREFDLSKNDFIKATKWIKEQITKTK